MGFNKKKKNIKDLDNVFKKIEQEEGIEETEEEKIERENKKKETNKLKLMLLLIVLLIVILIVLYTSFSIYDKINGQYSDLKLKSRDELMIRNVDETLLTNYLQKGKYTFVSFWASWCPHCQSEAPTLNKFMVANKNINFIVVSHDKKIEDLKEYFDKNNSYNWFVIFDSERTIRKLVDPSASSVPKTYLLDDEGNVVDRIDGEASFDELAAMYEKALLN